MLSGIMGELTEWARQQPDSDVKLAELRAAANGELRLRRRDELSALSAKYGIRASLVDARRIAEVESALEYCSACPGYDACRYGGLKPAMEINNGATYYVIECEARRRRIEAAERRRAYELACLPENVDEGVLEYASSLYDEERGVYVSGECKTSILTHIGRRRIVNGHHTLYVSVPEVMSALLPSAGGSAELMATLKSVESLLIDDVGLERAGEWSIEQMYIIIEARLRRGLWTSGAGLSISELKSKYGERVLRRIVKLMRNCELGIMN